MSPVYPKAALSVAVEKKIRRLKTETSERENGLRLRIMEATSNPPPLTIRSASQHNARIYL
jgi:hypothetical protein